MLDWLGLDARPRYGVPLRDALRVSRLGSLAPNQLPVRQRTETALLLLPLTGLRGIAMSEYLNTAELAALLKTTPNAIYPGSTGVRSRRPPSSSE